MAPTIVMATAITAAKIGRVMKKRDKRMETVLGSRMPTARAYEANVA
jgi:hypothetical protein